MLLKHSSIRIRIEVATKLYPNLDSSKELSPGTGPSVKTFVSKDKTYRKTDEPVTKKEDVKILL